jgi:hypothetical protein
MPDIALVRKQLRQAIDVARREAAGRRERADVARRAFETFLEETGVPVFRAFANALRAEGLPFEVMTPAGAVRLVPDRNRDEGIAVELDTTVEPPAAVFIVTKSRGNRVTRTERPVKEGVLADRIEEDDLAEMLLDALQPWMA